MIDVLAALGVLLVGLYLAGFGLLCLIVPARGARFLGGFASSAAAHYAELALRLIAGTAFIVHAPSTRAPDTFAAAGWVLVGTTAVLCLVPWRLHRRFARWSVPQATRYPRLLGLASLALGALVVASVVAAR